MFDLEQAIAEWRNQMLSAGISTPAPLDELEIHLREEIERRIKCGIAECRAFEIAVQRIGDATWIEQEFQKVETTRRDTMRMIAIIASLFGTVLGGGLLLPALGQWRAGGVLHVGPLLTGSILEILAICGLIWGVGTHRATRHRNLITVFMVAAGSFYEVPLIQAFFIRETDLTGWIFCAVLAGVAVLFYGSCLRRLWRSPTLPISESR